MCGMLPIRRDISLPGKDSRSWHIGGANGLHGSNQKRKISQQIDNYIFLLRIEVQLGAHVTTFPRGSWARKRNSKLVDTLIPKQGMNNLQLHGIINCKFETILG